MSNAAIITTVTFPGREHRSPGKALTWTGYLAGANNAIYANRATEMTLNTQLREINYCQVCGRYLSGDLSNRLTRTHITWYFSLNLRQNLAAPQSFQYRQIIVCSEIGCNFEAFQWLHDGGANSHLAGIIC